MNSQLNSQNISRNIRLLIVLVGGAILTLGMLILFSQSAHQVQAKGLSSFLNGTRSVESSDTLQPLELVGEIIGLTYPRDVVVQGGYAYVVDGKADYSGNQNTLYIIDVSNPLSPTIVGSYLANEITSIKVSGNYVYLVHNKWSDSELAIINVSTPSNPTKVSSYSVYGSSGCMGCVRSVTVQGHYAFLNKSPVFNTEWSGAGIIILDIIDPSKPKRVGFYSLAGNSNLGGLTITSTYLYGSLNDGSFYNLMVFDISTPITPTNLGHYQLQRPYSFTIIGDHAYLAEPDYALPVFPGRLEILDVTDPTNLAQIGTLSMTGSFGEINVDNENYVYIKSGGKLKVIDSNIPAHPVSVGEYNLSSFRSMNLVGDYIYIVGQSQFSVYWLNHPTSKRFTPTVGGILTSLDEMTVFDFPINTFTQAITVTYRTRYANHMLELGNLVGIDEFFEIDGINDDGQSIKPAQPYTVTITYPDTLPANLDEESLGLYYWDGELSVWAKEPSSKVNVLQNTISATPQHFSVWGILGQLSQKIYLPLVKR